MMQRALTGWLLCLAALSAVAAPPAVVEGLQPPAWLKRDGVSFPLAPGMVLQSRDRLVSGSGARVLLRLEEGSTVKLGEKATLDLGLLEAPEQPEGVFRGALEVVQGAFRLTTAALSRQRKRNMGVRVGTITAGIRGTDIWGKADKQRDLIALLEGSIQVSHGGDASFAMRDAMTYFSVLDGGVAQAVTAIPADQLPQWAAETELETGGGILRRQGEWRLNLGFYRSQRQSHTALQFYRGLGYAIEETPFRYRGRRHYRLHLDNFPSREEARAVAQKLDQRFGLVAIIVRQP